MEIEIESIVLDNPTLKEMIEDEKNRKRFIEEIKEKSYDIREKLKNKLKSAFKEIFVEIRGDILKKIFNVRLKFYFHDFKNLVEFTSIVSKETILKRLIEMSDEKNLKKCFRKLKQKKSNFFEVFKYKIKENLKETFTKLLDDMKLKKKENIAKEKFKADNKFEYHNGFIKKCTYDALGDEKNFQFEYYCKRCILGKICSICIQTCHTNCVDKIPTKRKEDAFVCECGIHEHFVCKEDENHFCQFNFIDKVFKNGKLFNGKCSICTIICENSNKLRPLDKDNEDVCRCSNENHRFSTLMLFNKFNMPYYFKILQQKLTHNNQNIKLPLQLINLVISPEVFSKYKKGFEIQLKDYLFRNNFPKNIIDEQNKKVYDLLQVSTDLLNGVNRENNRELIEKLKNYKEIKKAIKDYMRSNFKKISYILIGCDIKNIFFPLYYTSETITDLLDFDKLLEIIRFDDENDDQKHIIMDIASVIFNLHLKKDFRLIKKFTTFDFLVTNHSDRDNYRKLLLNSYPEIYKKYIKLKKFILKDNIFSILVIIYHGGDPNYGAQDRKFILKIIIFFLKHFLFEQNELHILIDNLWEFAKITKHFDKYFVKIFLLISINYNDLALTSHKNPSEINKINFVHHFNHWTEKLSKMVCLYYNDLTSHNEFDKDFYSNENLKLFLNPNNFYKDSNVTINDNKHFLFSDCNNLFQFEDSHKCELFDEKLKLKIDEILKEFFCDPLKEKITEEEQMNLSDPFDKIVELLKKQLYKFPKKSGTKNFITLNSNSNSINNKKLQNIIKNFKYLYKYVEHHENNIDIEKTSNFLIKSSVDEILTFSLNINKKFKEKQKHSQSEDYDSEVQEINQKIENYNRNISHFNDLYYSEENLEYILNFLQLFFMSRKSLKYFCLGQNLVRIFSLINKYPRQILQFFCLLFKAVKFYAINLKNHKILIMLYDAYKKFLKEIQNWKILKNGFEVYYNCIKLVNYTSHFYDQEGYNEIRTLFSEALIKFDQSFNLINAKEIQKLRENFTSNNGVINNEINLITDDKTSIDFFTENSFLKEENFNSNRNLFYKITGFSDNRLGNEEKIKFFYEFFKFFTKNTFFMEIDDEYLNKILIFVEEPIQFYTNFSVNNQLSPKKKKILNRMILYCYFSDRIYKNKYTENYAYLSSKEYASLYKFNNDELNIFTKPLSLENKDLTIKHYQKYDLIHKILTHMDFFQKELMNLNKETAMDNLNYKEYFVELIFSIKFIVDKFLIYEECWKGINNKIFKLIDAFAIKKDEMIKIIEENLVFNKKIDFEFRSTNSNSINKIESTDLFNNNRLHQFFNENFLPFSKCFDDNVCYYNNIEIFSNLNYTTESLIAENQFEHFYKTNTKFINKINLNTNNYYDDQFIDVKNLAIIQNNFEIGATKNPSILILKYFKNLILQKEKLTSSKAFIYILIMNKLLFHNTDETQQLIYNEFNKKHAGRESQEVEQIFFKKYFEFLKENLKKNISYSRNFFSEKINYTFNLLTTESIHFLRLLSENLNKNFHPFIFNHPKGGKDDSIFKYLFELFIDYYKIIHSREHLYKLPDDNLIILLNYLYEFLVEYIQTCEDEDINDDTDSDQKEKTHLQYIKQYFFASIQDCKNEEKRVFYYKDRLVLDRKQTFSYMENEYYRLKIRCYARIKLIELWIEFLHSKKYDTNNFNLNSFLDRFDISEFINEITFHFNYITNYLVSNRKLDKNFRNFKRKKFVDVLTELFKNNEEFRESLQLKLCFKIFILLKTIADVHELPSFKNYYDNLNYMTYSIDDQSTKESSFDNKDKNIYAFLDFIVRKVEISRNGKNSYYYFIRHLKTFYLKEKTKNRFLNTVDRDTTYSKLSTLIEETDYFIYEMITNYHNRNFPNILTDFLIKIRISRKLSLDLKYDYFNLIFVILHQIFLFLEFYREPSNTSYKDAVNTNKLSSNNFYLSIIQICILFIILIPWSIFEFPFIFQHSLMQETGKKFIFKSYDPRKNLKFSIIQKILNGNLSSNEILNMINSDVSRLDKFISVCKSIINREITFLIISFTLTLIYLFTNSPICLVLQLFCIINLSQNLFDIIYALWVRIDQWTVIYAFSWLMIYMFSWFSLLYLNDIYEFDDVKNSKGDKIIENFCKSPLQCALFTIDNGIRAGGGIGDKLPVISFKENPSIFVGKFFFTILFHIIIILIIGNIFLGIIVDTYSDLRDYYNRNEDDKKRKCFICQITEDNTLKTKINFRNHKYFDHKIWSYVYFLSELHLIPKDKHDPFQRSVWEKLKKNDISWIPIIDSSES